MEHIQFTLNGLFEWIFAVLVAMAIFFLYSTFKQNADDKKTMMEQINKLTEKLNSLLVEHNLLCKRHYKGGDTDD